MKRIMSLLGFMVLTGCADTNTAYVGYEPRTVEIIDYDRGHISNVTIRDIQTDNIYKVELGKGCYRLSENAIIGDTFVTMFRYRFIDTGNGEGWKLYKPKSFDLKTKLCRYQGE